MKRGNRLRIWILQVKFNRKPPQNLFRLEISINFEKFALCFQKLQILFESYPSSFFLISLHYFSSSWWQNLVFFLNLGPSKYQITKACHRLRADGAKLTIPFNFKRWSLFVFLHPNFFLYKSLSIPWLNWGPFIKLRIVPGYLGG